VHKYRSIDEVPRPASTGSPTDDVRAAVELSVICQRLGSLRPHRGIVRYAGVGQVSENTHVVKAPAGD
jgi:hypothetical protein